MDGSPPSTAVHLTVHEVDLEVVGAAITASPCGHPSSEGGAESGQQLAHAERLAT